MNSKTENKDWNKGWERFCLADDRSDCRSAMQRLGFDDAAKFAQLHKKKAVA